jgi:YVTN family beta-propeller protein
MAMGARGNYAVSGELQNDSSSAPDSKSQDEFSAYASPCALAPTSDGKILFVACSTAGQVVRFETVQNKVTARIPLPDAPCGLVLSSNGALLYVACAAPKSTICILDTSKLRVLEKISTGHTSMSPVLGPREDRLYVCNRFNNDVSVIDLRTWQEIKRVAVEREPVAGAVTPDGRYLIVANHLHAQTANRLHIGASVSVIDTEKLALCKNIELTLGASFLNGVAISPNGKFAAVTHVHSMYWLSTTGVELGRMNGSALTVLDLDKLEVLGMIFLDQTLSGAAMPWGVAWTQDGNTIAVANSSAHAISLVDAPTVADPASFGSTRIGAYEPTERGMAPLPKQRPVRLQKRIAVPGQGPRAVALAGSQFYTANYFSEDLCRIDLSADELQPELLSLGRVRAPTIERKGEMLFNNAQLCFQGWQSCASCHDVDGRTDALNWDLLNDGIANPKNTRTLLYAHESGVAMALGVRTNAEEAVRAGIHHILFSEQPEEVAGAIDAYLKSLRPIQSPHLAAGHLSDTAKHGESLFRDPKTGCLNCHPPPLFTDGKAHDVGTTTEYRSLYQTPGADRPSDLFYSPVLVELWRTAPYLHDGSALTLRDVLTKRNPDDRHGRTSHLTGQEIEDLVQYLLSL